MRDFIDVVFDGPPSHTSGRFVEVEDAARASIGVGVWIDRGDGMWALRITPAAFTAENPQVIVKYDSNYEVTQLVCPRCGKDDIREHDRAERWNPIEIVNGGLAVNQLQSDFETVGLVCADCCTELDAPQEVYERMGWS